VSFHLVYSLLLLQFVMGASFISPRLKVLANVAKMPPHRYKITLAARR